MELHKCKCGNLAVYYYMPSSDNKNIQRAFCEDCVPRGCTCNQNYARTGSYIDDHGDTIEYDGIFPDEDDIKHGIKWIDEYTWCRVDEQGREYPCCEFMWDEEGFEIYEDEKDEEK